MTLGENIGTEQEEFGLESTPPLEELFQPLTQSYKETLAFYLGDKIFEMGEMLSFTPLMPKPEFDNSFPASFLLIGKERALLLHLTDIRHPKHREQYKKRIIEPKHKEALDDCSCVLRLDFVFIDDLVQSMRTDLMHSTSMDPAYKRSEDILSKETLSFLRRGSELLKLLPPNIFIVGQASDPQRLRIFNKILSRTRPESKYEIHSTYR